MIEENKKVSVVIPTHNRFVYLLNAIRSIQNQTHENLEIIVVNDGSTQEDYYSYDWKTENKVSMIHLKEGSRRLFGFPSPGYVRNVGIENSTGSYIAYCDDDDIWFPNKTKKQIEAMNETGCKMSTTEGLIGFGVYDSSKKYKKYNSENFYQKIRNIHEEKGSRLLEKGFPRIWNLKFLLLHNCAITSSVIVKRDVLQRMKSIKAGIEDYDCWLRTLLYTNSVYVPDICFYYDRNHGDGRNY